MRFASEVISAGSLILISWLIVCFRIGVKFRNSAEKVSKYRLIQATVFACLLALTVGVLQLPLAMFDEWALKLYHISVQPWPSWFQDWAVGQGLVIVVATIAAYIVNTTLRKTPKRLVDLLLDLFRFRNRFFRIHFPIPDRSSL